MLWLVRYALRKSYSVAAMALLIFAAGLISYLRLPVDVLPAVNIPAVKVIWTYQGLNANEMASKITTFSEVAIMNNVDNVREIRSQTMSGTAVVHIEFQPSVDIANAMTQITSVSQTIMRRMPAGITPPLITQYNQSSTPILQLVMSSNTLTDAQLSDFARLQLRGMIQSINGIRLTLPYGGGVRQIMIDLKPDALHALGLSAAEVTQALAQQNLTLPSGSIREGLQELQISVNASPESISSFEEMPVKSIDGRMVYLRDVADIRDGTALQTNIARVNGDNAVMVSLIKLGDASTVDIINQVMDRLPSIRAAAPPGIDIQPIFDQSVFVNTAVHHIQTEILIVGSLVAIMVLLFIGSWRATLIVLTSIPLSLLTALFALNITGHTLNLMSLGGLALAIGILVDNALVEIENIKRNLAQGLSARQATVTSASQVAFPELVSTLSTCVVFSPIFLLTGVAGYIFKPLAIVVIASLLASYVLSRTVVPALAVILLPNDEKQSSTGIVMRVHGFVMRRLAWAQRRLAKLLVRLQHQLFVVPLAMFLILATGFMAFSDIGRDFFPKTDAGLMRFYVRAEPGLRIEQTAERFADIQVAIRQLIPEDELDFIVENIGMPDSINRGWVDSFTIGSYDGEIQIQLAPGHQPTADYEAAIRQMLRQEFPDITLFAQPADTTNQTLSGTTPTAIDVRFSGRDHQGNLTLAERLIEQMQDFPGAADVGLQQVFELPEYFISIDRSRAAQLGLTPQMALDTVLSALGSAGTVASSFWADPASGFSYAVQVQAPVQEMNNIDALLNLAVAHTDSGQEISLGSIANISPRLVPASVGRATLQPTINVLINTENSDLGSVYDEVKRAIAPLRSELKPGNNIRIMGQADAMQNAYRDLMFGFLLAVFFIYIVMLFNFASWTLPLVALSAAPVAISGAMMGLWITNTTLSVPALMGFIMVIGVSTANSVLVTTFARDRWLQGVSASAAARKAAITRFRPVLMTALTMIIGLMPMALALGEGGEQNAPLARTVIGGLILGTCASLVIVPWIFSKLMTHISRPVPVNEADLTLKQQGAH